MLSWTAGAALILVAFALVHVLCAAGVLWWRATPPAPPAGFAPRVAVLLPIRGCDPSLLACVRGLVQQTYPAYEVHLIVDRSTEDAWSLLAPFATSGTEPGRPPVHLHELRDPPEQCSLKCAALAQAARTLAGVEVVATLDADVVPHPDWLTTLVAPLADPAIGAVTGNHWFEPKQWNAGSTLRSLWNAGSLVPTTFFANPWGGTLAFRWADMQAAGWIDRWERSAVDDGPARSAVAALGRRIVFVPSLVMLNREICSFRFFWNYQARMLTWSRWYEPSFAFTVAHALVNGTPWCVAVGCGLVAASQGAWPVAGIAALGLVLHTTALWLAYLVVRRGVGRIAAARGEPLPSLSASALARTWYWTPVAFVCQLLAVFRAAWAREVEWRGVRYRLRGPQQVERRGGGPPNGALVRATESGHSL